LPVSDAGHQSQTVPGFPQTTATSRRKSAYKARCVPRRKRDGSAIKVIDVWIANRHSTLQRLFKWKLTNGRAALSVNWLNGP
jgi:hypothetical protein